MKLGTRTQITLGVPDLEAESTFFTDLGYQLIDENTEPYPWRQFSDGQNLILLNQDGMTYRGLVYFNPELDALVEAMEAAGVEFFWKQQNEDGSYQSAMFIDPHGIDGKNGAENLGVNIVAHDPEGLHQPAGEPITHCGKFGEFAVPISDLAASRDFWAQFGFEVLYIQEEGGSYPWGILHDGMIVLGQHQHGGNWDIENAFELPALTFFSKESADHIAYIKAKGYQPIFELTDDNDVVVNAGFESPSGQPFYIFNGEI